MAQGLGFTPEQKESIIQSLKPYLEMGYSRNKACAFVGLTPTTLSNWVKNDEALCMKLQGWENVINTTVLGNLYQAIQMESKETDTKKETSKWWAERKMKDEFSTKVESEINATIKDSDKIQKRVNDIFEEGVEQEHVDTEQTEA